MAATSQPTSTEGLLITVRSGTGEPASVALTPGREVGPVTIGRVGSWPIVAPGVLEEHGYVYFDGAALFLQSARAESPLYANGTAIPGAWTAVLPPCEIRVGGAVLWFAAPDAQPATAVAPGMRSPRVQGNDDELRTRMMPVEQTMSARGRKNPLPAVGAPGFAPAPPPAFAAPVPPAPALGPPPAPAPIAIPAAVAPAPPASGPLPGAPAVPGTKPSWIAERWREASGPKKALVFLMAPLMWAVWVIFTDQPPPPRPPKPAASASARPSATPASSSVEPPQPTAAEPTPVPSASAGAKAAASTSPATTGPRTAQREAADAVAAGAFDRAAKLYDDLAKAHPDVPAYAEAARILNAKAGKH